jgi:hypothetical protein
MRIAPTHANPQASAGGRMSFGLGAAVVALSLAALTIQTWRKWGDMILDFGVQLYLPWRISAGSVLFRDVQYLTGGPLSQYYHALLFRVFGVSVLTVVISNLVILFFLAGMIYFYFYRISDAWTATMAGLAFAFVFAFEEYRSLGIFNYVSPYSHEIVHGLVISIVVLALLARWLEEGSLALAFWSGVGGGLVLLTKPEVSLALCLAQASALILCWLARRNIALMRNSTLAMAGGMVLMPAAFFVYFVQSEAVGSSLRSVLWPWVAIFRHTTDNDFYRWCLGLSAPTYNLKMILLETAGLAVILGCYARLCRIRASGLMGKILLVLAGLAIGNLSFGFNWDQCGYALPALCLASIGLLLWQARANPVGEVQPWPLLWGVFSLSLLAKLGIYPRIWHYGFVLAMPAFLSAVYFLLWLLPSFLERHGAQSIYFRAMVSLGLLIGFGQLWHESKVSYNQRTAQVGQGSDQILVSRPNYLASGVTMGRVTSWIQANTPPHSTLAVLPDGAMVNFLSRRINPTGYLRWNPVESAAFGQENMEEAFMRSSSQPDYIILLEITINQFGLKPFGEDPLDGLKLKQWIISHYHPVYHDTPPNLTVYEKGLAQEK